MPKLCVPETCTARARAPSRPFPWQTTRFSHACQETHIGSGEWRGLTWLHNVRRIRVSKEERRNVATSRVLLGTALNGRAIPPKKKHKPPASSTLGRPQRQATSDCCRPWANRRRLAISCRRLSANPCRLSVNCCRSTEPCHRQPQAVVCDTKEKRKISFLNDSPAPWAPVVSNDF